MIDALLALLAVALVCIGAVPGFFIGRFVERRSAVIANKRGQQS